jgi:hypothetical protein
MACKITKILKTAKIAWKMIFQPYTIAVRFITFACVAGKAQQPGATCLTKINESGK